MTRTLTGVVAAGVLMIAASSADAGDYVVGVENIQYMPHYSWDGQEYTGFGRDLLDAFAKDAGHTFTYRGLPVTRLFRALVDGEIDLKYPDNPYWSADLKATSGKTVKYSQAVVKFIDGVLVKPELKGVGIEKISSLGTVRGFTAWSWVPFIEKGQVEKKENSSFQGLMKQGATGRVDAVFSNVAVAVRQLTELGMPGALVFDGSLPHTKDNYLASSTTQPELITEFNNWLTDNADKVAELKAKYKVEQGVDGAN